MPYIIGFALGAWCGAMVSAVAVTLMFVTAVPAGRTGEQVIHPLPSAPNVVPFVKPRAVA